MPERFIKGEITGGRLAGVKVVMGPIPAAIEIECDTVASTEMCGPVVLRLEENPPREVEIKPRSRS